MGRDVRITVRLTEEEYQLINDYAFHRDISISEAVRELALMSLKPNVLKILETLKKYGLIKYKLVYKYVNGKTEVSEEPLSTLVMELIRDREEDFSVEVSEPPLGSEYRYFYVFPRVIIEKRVWSPSPPYSWTEETIYIYTF